MIRHEVRWPFASRVPMFGCVLIVLSACGGRGHEMSQDAERSGGPAVVSVTADAETYAPGDTIGLTLELQNNGNAPLVLDFSTGQRYDFAVLTTEGETAWSWSAGRSFMQMLGQETVQPNERLQFRERVRPDLPPGTFRLVGRIVARDRDLTDTTVVVIRR